MSLSTKSDSLSLIFSGPRWNHARTWQSLADLRRSGFPGNVVIRSRQVGFATVYNLPQSELDAKLASLARAGHDTSRFYFNESCPDNRLIIQGELIGRSLTYTTVRLPTKMAFHREERHAEGASTEAILRWACNANSYADLQEMRAEHPDAVIEFGCYEVCLGSRPDRNLLFWEARESF